MNRRYKRKVPAPGQNRHRSLHRECQVQARIMERSFGQPLFDRGFANYVYPACTSVEKSPSPSRQTRFGSGSGTMIL